MSTADLKTSLHQLIDGIQDSNFLESLYEILSEQKNAKDGHLWNSLTDAQRQEVMDAYHESEDPDNLSPHSEVIRKLRLKFIDVNVP